MRLPHRIDCATLLFLTTLYGCSRPVEQELKIDVGGHRLRMLVVGDHGPTVVLESGLPGGAGWKEVRQAVGRFARVVTYDRAGIGKSEPGPQPRDAEQIVKELHTALHTADLPPPYLLVGQSMGGPYMRVFAARHPDEVCGLVLVDPTDADAIEPLDDVKDWFARHHPDHSAQIDAICARAPEGMEALLMSSFKAAEESFAKLPAKRRKAVRREWYALLAGAQRSTFEPTLSPGARDEMKAAMSSVQQAVVAKPLPSIRVVLISAGQPDAYSEATASLSPNMRDLHESLQNWQVAGYRNWVDATPGAELWVARQSGHNVQTENPRLVVNAIRTVLKNAKGLKLE